MYQIRHTAYKEIVPEDGLIQFETCRAYIEKYGLITRTLCNLLVYIHTTDYLGGTIVSTDLVK
jgi:hypothetical protein